MWMVASYSFLQMLHNVSIYKKRSDDAIISDLFLLEPTFVIGKHIRHRH